MGGHGGLNILPQKKWNVYNYDNRAKVARDERKVQDKKEREKSKKNYQESELRLQQMIKEKKKQQVKIEENSKQNELEQHINLFQEEERMALNQSNKSDLGQSSLINKQDKNYFQDKKYDLSTKFNGSQSQGSTKPWYTLPPMTYSSQLKLPRNDVNQCKNFDSTRQEKCFQNSNLTKVTIQNRNTNYKQDKSYIQHKSNSPKESKIIPSQTSENQNCRSRSRSLQKNSSQKKNLDQEKEDEQRKISRLRYERITRERKEQLRQQQILQKQQYRMGKY